jgi:hypothetical protein
VASLITENKKYATCACSVGFGSVSGPRDITYCNKSVIPIHTCDTIQHIIIESFVSNLLFEGIWREIVSVGVGRGEGKCYEV